MQARRWAKGNRITDPDPRLALYVDCKTWGCLPNAGGWYDQSPEVCDAFAMIENEVNSAKAAEARRRR